MAVDALALALPKDLEGKKLIPGHKAPWIESHDRAERGATYGPMAPRDPMATNVKDIVIRGVGKMSVTTEKKEEETEEQKKFQLDAVWTQFGCAGGVGSDFLNKYRRHANREKDRLAMMDKDWKEKEEAMEFQAKRAAKMMADDEAAAKKTAKRQKKKEAQAKAKAAAKEAKSFNKVENDGSWLEKMMKMSETEMQEQLKKTQPAKMPEGVKAAPQVSVAQMSSSANITFREIE
eukprot:TRINITY_DN91978_c0_g1_i1.p1 TRINITY_DN91978_c0_g1~~TRINITY_DN91978_c0_g1_i1.p1  ORF type:complete len:234 (+),score=99.13 TRINITY_DN91978_c0_g1_i1:100-801(+)